MYSINRGLLLLSLVVFMVACDGFEIPDEAYQNESATKSNQESWVVDNDFTFRTEENIDLNISICDNNGDALKKVPFRLFLYKGNGVEPDFLVSGMSDENGEYQNSFVLDKNIKTLMVNVNYPGFQNYQIITIDDTIINYKIDPRIEPISVDPFLSESEEFVSKSNKDPLGLTFNYFGSYNNSGVPSYFESVNDVIGQDILDLLAGSLPEGQPVPDYNPQYISSGNAACLIVEEEAEVWITFIHEGAGYRNSVGYYTYPTSNPPSSPYDINELNILFPNTSFSGSGGGLSTGNKVYLGSFNPGTSIGWFIIPDGWNNSSRIVEEKQNKDAKFSNSALNEFTNKAYQSHCVVLKDDGEQSLYLGFEDINRPGGDNDFNDAIFYIKATPYSSINTKALPPVRSDLPDLDNDGTPDNADTFLDDPEISFVSYVPGEGLYGTLAYEDLWPLTGDYDMNDMVIDYNIAEYRNSNNLVVKTRATFIVKAMGAGLQNGFGFQTNLNPSQIASVEGSELYESFINLAPNGVEQGQSKAVFIVFDNGFKAMESSTGFVNTNDLNSFVTPDTIVMDIDYVSPVAAGQIGAAPYNPFIFTGLRRGYEVHLPDMPGTNLADNSLFQTAADDSNPATGKYYKTVNGLPWALHFANQFDYPKEKVNLNQAYNHFFKWVLSSGNEYPDWYYDNSGYRESQNIYQD